MALLQRPLKLQEAGMTHIECVVDTNKVHPAILVAHLAAFN
jgi:hypothetical protein